MYVWIQYIFNGHKTSHVIIIKYMSCAHMICLITRHVLRSQHMSPNHRTTCLVLTTPVFGWKYIFYNWSQDVSRDHKTCIVVTRHVWRPQNICRAHKISLVIVRYVLIIFILILIFETDIQTDRLTSGRTGRRTDERINWQASGRIDCCKVIHSWSMYSKCIWTNTKWLPTTKTATS